MKLPALARISIVLLVIAGCTSAPSVSPAPTEGETPAPTMASATVSPTPEPTVGPTLAPTDSPPTPEAKPRRPRPSLAAPPVAALGTSDNAVTGKLGSYCWSTGCVDFAGFYKARTPAITFQEGDTLIFSMEDGEFANWTASYGIDVTAATVLGQGGDPVDPDSSQPPPDLLTFAEFDAPPAGDWIVEVFVHFEDNWDAFYGWHVTVE